MVSEATLTVAAVRVITLRKQPTCDQALGASCTESTMQRVCSVPGGVESYLGDHRILLNSETRCCPFCPDQHPLRIHGVYKRFVLLPGFSRPVRIKVLRLLCPREGQSVSLLPAFCLPQRQYGAAILGRFLKARLLLGATLGAALHWASSQAPAVHSLAQAWVASFLTREQPLRNYVNSLFPRLPQLDPVLTPDYRVAPLLAALLKDFDCPERAFEHHGVGFHRQFQKGLV